MTHVLNSLNSLLHFNSARRFLNVGNFNLPNITWTDFHLIRINNILTIRY